MKIPAFVETATLLCFHLSHMSACAEDGGGGGVGVGRGGDDQMLHS